MQNIQMIRGGTWRDASDKENKTEKKDNNTQILLTTGASDDFVAKNMYDIAGNCNEFTMEAYSNDMRVRRSRWL